MNTKLGVLIAFSFRMAVGSIADADDSVAFFATAVAAAGGVSKNIVLRRECAIVLRLLLVRGFSAGFFFSSLFDNVDAAAFTSHASFRFRFGITVFFVSVFCGVTTPIGLCSGNSEGGANNFRFNGLIVGTFVVSDTIDLTAAVGGVAAVVVVAATTTLSN